MDFQTFITENWVPLLIGAMAFAKVIVNLTLPKRTTKSSVISVDVLITAITGDRRKQKREQR